MGQELPTPRHRDDLSIEHVLEPHIRDTSAVAPQVVKTSKPIEMVHDDGGHRPRLRKPQIDGDAAATVLIGREAAPIGDARALRAKMKAEMRAPDIHTGGARHLYPLVSWS